MTRSASGSAQWAGRLARAAPGVVRNFAERLADLIEPLSGDRERALDASIAFLGRILTSIALGTDQPAAPGDSITRAIDYFDPRPQHDSPRSP